MQILSVILYNGSGATQRWDFQPDIITGARRSGKTALLRIVEYCMGKGECDIPKGVIRNSVAWYGVLFQASSTRVFVARRSPVADAETSSDIYFTVGADIDVAPFTSLRKVIDIDGLVGTLGDLVGIGENLHIPGEQWTRDPLEANLKHTWFYLFQWQEEVAVSSFLFHREKENSFMQQSIKDTLPYFLGVVRDDHFAKQEELKRLRKEARRVSRRLAESEWIRGEALSRGKVLAAEAQELGMDENAEIPEEQDRLVKLLRRIAGWKPATLSEVPGLALGRLQDERSHLLNEFRQLKDQLDSVLAFSADQERYISEASDQQVRLETVGLLKRPEPNFHCPLCNTELESTLPNGADLNRSLEELSQQLETVARERTRLDRVIAERKDALAVLRQRVRDKTAQINAALDQNATTVEKRELENSRLAAVGKVELYLETLENTEDDSQAKELLDQYTAQIRVLEEELSEDDYEIVLSSIINLISKKMSDWSKTLDYEYADSAQRFDLNHLTLIADAQGGPIKMAKMGGGTNALSCHFLVLLGFHQWFVTRGRPVPNFLMLDQISQVYFPSDSTTDPTEDERIAIRQMYLWLFDRVSEMAGKFQLIVTDHADLDEPWFKSAVIDRWRSGKKMIPSEWIKIPDVQ